jgi:stearoyl-CoA desaturase (Delta-9 desaturase)
MWAEKPVPELPNASGRLLYFLVALVTIVVPIAGLAWGVVLLARQGISGLDIALLVGMYLLTVLGVELGFHRYLTHRSMKTSRWMHVLLTIAGSMAAQGQPIWWVAIHRRHHGHSDHEGDPHSPNLHGESLWQQLVGGWHSHIGWMFQPRCTAAHASHYAKDLLSDRTMITLDRWYFAWVLLGLAIPAAVGGLVTGTSTGAVSGLVWGGLVRMFFGQHALWWGIVTLCHRYGTRPFQSNDDSTNHWLGAVLFLGGGWHNNHHAFPASAKVGLRWWEFDITWRVVRLLERTGIVWDVKVPSAKAVLEKRRVA